MDFADIFGMTGMACLFNSIKCTRNRKDKYNGTNAFNHVGAWHANPAV